MLAKITHKILAEIPTWMQSEYVGDLTFSALVQKILNLLVVIVVIAAVIYLIMNGLKFVTSGGDAGKAQEAQKGITYAIIGIIVAVAAGLIVNFVLNRLNTSIGEGVLDDAAE